MSRGRRVPKEPEITKAMAARRRREAKRQVRAILLGQQLIAVIEREAKASALEHGIDPEEFLDYLEEKIGTRVAERNFGTHGAPRGKRLIYENPHPQNGTRVIQGFGGES